MKLPEIQNRLRELAGELGCVELAHLADEMSRRKGARAPVTSTCMTDALRAEIRMTKRLNPDVPNNRIAAMFDVNPGRVSEALHGWRS